MMPARAGDEKQHAPQALDLLVNMARSRTIPGLFLLALTSPSTPTSRTRPSAQDDQALRKQHGSPRRSKAHHKRPKLSIPTSTKCRPRKAAATMAREVAVQRARQESRFRFCAALNSRMYLRTASLALNVQRSMS